MDSPIEKLFTAELNSEYQFSFVLPDEHIVEILKDEICNKKEMFVAGYVDLIENNLYLWNANIEFGQVSLDIFTQSGSGSIPNFKEFHIVDYGHGIAFGKGYEAASDWVSDHLKIFKKF